MLSARITGIGWVTAGGCGRGRRLDHFVLSAGELPALLRADVFARPDRRFGRMDPFSRLGLAGIAFALRDAGLEEWEQKRPVGLIAATAYGCLGTDCDYFDSVVPDGGALASPQLFAYTLSNTFLGEAAIRFGLTGCGLVVSTTGVPGLAPLGLALESLAWGEEESVVAGICDLNPPVGVPDVPGVLPGAVFLVLEREVREGIVSYGELRRDGEGKYWLAGVPVGDMGELVARCLLAEKSD
jgi:3-oxoacyl-[acyl-carrier-protein] synthase II